MLLFGHTNVQYTLGQPLKSNVAAKGAGNLFVSKENRCTTSKKREKQRRTLHILEGLTSAYLSKATLISHKGFIKW